MRFICPHCKSRMTSRTTRPMSLLSFESYQRCSNVECNFRCKVLAEIVAELKPAELRNPAVVLPVVHTAQPIPTHPRPFPTIEALKQAGVAETAAEQEGA
ncbi:ogr/Delta-like zinc finger family protein [Aeromonas caviae]|nr:ogr/Delta-like zinc finger family protein [Aeromonas caviae]MDH0316059.1 ogr/Delta-like zinc finger family protein [Aeromonas caviae]